MAVSVAGLDDSADVTRCDLLPQTHVEDEEVSSYKDEERVGQYGYKGTWRRTLLLHERRLVISSLCCSSICSIASPWLRCLFMALLLLCLLCCFSGSSSILCLLCCYLLSPLLLCLLCAPLSALRFSAYFALLRLLCASLLTLRTSVCSVAPLSIQAACSVALLRGTGRISLASIIFLIKTVLTICSPLII